MRIRSNKFIRAYGFSVLLIISVLSGALLGIIYGKDAIAFKPLGDIFLNLLFTIIIPLVFFPFLQPLLGCPI